MSHGHDEEMYPSPMRSSSVRRQHDHDQNPDGTSLAANIASVKMTQNISDLVQLASMVDASDPFKKYIIEKGQHDFRYQRASFDNQVILGKKLSAIALESNDNKQRLDTHDDEIKKKEVEQRQNAISEAYQKGVHDREKQNIEDAASGREKRLSTLVKVASFGSPVICYIIWILLSLLWNGLVPSHPIPTKLGP